MIELKFPSGGGGRTVLTAEERESLKRHLPADLVPERWARVDPGGEFMFVALDDPNNSVAISKGRVFTLTSGDAAFVFHEWEHGELVARFTTDPLPRSLEELMPL